jgi:hypothetical protein
MRRGIFAGLAAIIVLVPGVAFADDTGFAYAHSLRKEGGRTCMSDHYHSGSGSGATKSAAQKSAIHSWANFTAFEYGSDWARWGVARSKSVRYTKDSSGWSADVDARPCRR